MSRSLVNQILDEVAGAFEIPSRLFHAFAQIESGKNPKARTGQYKGMFQLSKSEFNKYGPKGGNIYNPKDNATAAAKKIAAESQRFEQKFGRAPTAADLYMVHQQGEGGYAAHASNPDAPAWQNMASTREGQQKGTAWAKKAVWGNLTPEARKQFGSVDNVTSGQFMKFWGDRVDGFTADPEGKVRARMRAPERIDMPARRDTALARNDSQPFLENFRAKGTEDIGGLNSSFRGRLASMFQAAPEDIRSGMQVFSAYRSPERQAQLYANAVQKYGSEAAARKWVAPPGRSMHGSGTAADLRFSTPAARDWAHENAGNFGLHFPLSNEPWHVEPLGTRGTKDSGSFQLDPKFTGGETRTPKLDIITTPGPEQQPAIENMAQPQMGGQVQTLDQIMGQRAKDRALSPMPAPKTPAEQAPGSSPRPEAGIVQPPQGWAPQTQPNMSGNNFPQPNPERVPPMPEPGVRDEQFQFGGTMDAGETFFTKEKLNQVFGEPFGDLMGPKTSNPAMRFDMPPPPPPPPTFKDDMFPMMSGRGFGGFGIFNQGMYGGGGFGGGFGGGDF